MFIAVPIDTPTDPNAFIVGALGVVVVALIGMVGLLVRTLSTSKVAAYHAEAANKAVNNVGPGEHSLWDQVAFIHEDVRELVTAQRDFAERGWATLPEDINTASKLTQTIRELQVQGDQLSQNDQVILQELVELRAFIEKHDEWEKSQKYLNPGASPPA